MQRTPLDCAYELGGKNHEILRALQKASGLSPDAEPIKLLSVPKGALAHSFVQRLRLQDNSNGRKQKLAESMSRIQQMKRGSSGPSSRCSPTPNQMNPDRRRLRRGETVEVSSPSGSLDAGPRQKERPLVRCHTLDSGVHTPEPPESPHVPNTTEDSLEGHDQPNHTHTPITSEGVLPATSRDGDCTEAYTSEQYSTDVSNCSTGSESSPHPPSDASPQANSSTDSSSPHIPTTRSAPHHPCEPSHTHQPADRESEECPDSHAQPLTAAEALQSESEDEDSSTAELHSIIQTDGGDWRNGNQTAETSAQSNQGSCD